MKEYLGDSVYVDFLDGYMICLTTENGMGPSNTIYLEPEVMQALVRYAESLKKQQPSGEVTGRLTSKDAVVQNIPRTLEEPPK